MTPPALLDFIRERTFPLGAAVGLGGDAGALMVCRDAAPGRAGALLQEMVRVRYGDTPMMRAPGGRPIVQPLAGRLTPFLSAAQSRHVAVALVAPVPVGIDVEVVRDVPDALAIARRWFGEAEVSALFDCSGRARDRLFLDLWTAREALAKWHGAGLRLSAETLRDMLRLTVRGAGPALFFLEDADFVVAIAGLADPADLSRTQPKAA
jgi:hypothetical protein